MGLFWHGLVRGLLIGSPLILLALLGLWQRRRAKENEKISYVLRRRAP